MNVLNTRHFITAHDPIEAVNNNAYVNSCKVFRSTIFRAHLSGYPNKIFNRRYNCYWCPCREEFSKWANPCIRWIRTWKSLKYIVHTIENTYYDFAAFMICKYSDGLLLHVAQFVEWETEHIHICVWEPGWVGGGGGVSDHIPAATDPRSGMVIAMPSSRSSG